MLNQPLPGGSQLTTVEVSSLRRLLGRCPPICPPLTPALDGDFGYLVHSYFTFVDLRHGTRERSRIFLLQRPSQLLRPLPRQARRQRWRHRWSKTHCRNFQRRFQDLPLPPAYQHRATRPTVWHVQGNLIVSAFQQGYINLNWVSFRIFKFELFSVKRLRFCYNDS